MIRFGKAPFKPIVNARTSPECARSRGVRKPDTHPSGPGPAPRAGEQHRQTEIPSLSDFWSEETPQISTYTSRPDRAGWRLPGFPCAQRAPPACWSSAAPFTPSPRRAEGDSVQAQARQSATGTFRGPITPMFLIPALGRVEMGAWRPQRGHVPRSVH